MKRLILDHFRRWLWVLVLFAVFAFTVGWFSDTSSEQFAMIAFFSLYTGVFLLSFDLQRGIARTVTALPLTAGQIGRAWWLASVGIPALGVSALLFLGAGTCHLFSPDKAFPLSQLCLASLMTLLWLGIGFSLIFTTGRGLYGSGWERARSVSLILLFGLMLGSGFLISQDIAKSPMKLTGFLTVGAALTFVGWFRAEQMVLGRATFRLSALQSKQPRGQHRAPTGYGGVAFLIATVYARGLLIGLGMLLILPVMMALQGQIKSWHDAMKFMGNMGGIGAMSSMFWMVILVQLVPLLMNLRFLRTLPIPATALAAVMLGVMVLPIITLAALMAGVAGIVMGPSAALEALKGYIFILAPASLCLCFAVWQGVGMKAYAGMMLLIMLTGFMPEMFRGSPFSIMILIVAVCVILAFVLTRLSLMRSSHTYRVPVNIFGSAWSTGR